MNPPMPKQTKEPKFEIADKDGRVSAEFGDNAARTGNVTNLLLLAILRELEAQRKGGKK